MSNPNAFRPDVAPKRIGTSYPKPFDAIANECDKREWFGKFIMRTFLHCNDNDKALL